MWMQHRAGHVREWWEQVRGLGFEQIELSHIITPAMIAGLEPGEIPVSSVHFPAPTVPHPTDARGADKLIASPDPTLRGWAVDQARRSIDLAATWGASAVCIHAGAVEVPWRLEWALRQRWLGGYFGTPVYGRTLDELLTARAAAAEPYFSAVRRSLEEIAVYAQQMGVRIGVETRVHVFEMPSLEEAQIILAEHDPDVLGLWYDAGHVQVQANLGLAEPRAWLETCGPRIVAAHLHDTRGLRDHLLPGAGDIDFELLTAHLPADALRVCEFDWYFEPEEIAAAARRLERMIWDNETRR